MKFREFSDIINLLFLKMCEVLKLFGNLKECSFWMSDFKVEFLRSELEIFGELIFRDDKIVF